MLIRAATLTALALFLAAPAYAQAPRDCGTLWKEADVDANGSLSREEDKRGYFDAFRVSGRQLLAQGTISRDEFLLYCAGSLDRPAEPGKQGYERPDNRGKGDMTPGLIPFPRDEAMKRIQALGYREIGDLTLDEKGIWRTSATVNGKQVPVSVDVQGDVLAGG